jgi:hypothetical protein
VQSILRGLHHARVWQYLVFVRYFLPTLVTLSGVISFLDAIRIPNQGLQGPAGLILAITGGFWLLQRLRSSDD